MHNLVVECVIFFDHFDVLARKLSFVLPRRSSYG